MQIERLLTNICCENLTASKSFYTSLFNLKVGYDSDWFVNLCAEGKDFELGLIAQDHEVVPQRVDAKVSGAYLTFVVEDVDALFSQAQAKGYEILQTPTPTSYGQKRMLLLAPEGTVCDVSSPISN